MAERLDYQSYPYVRRVVDTGSGMRVTIPAQAIELMGIQPGDQIEIAVTSIEEGINMPGGAVYRDSRQLVLRIRRSEKS